jgi:hypothetical protein
LVPGWFGTYINEAAGFFYPVKIQAGGLVRCVFYTYPAHWELLLYHKFDYRILLAWR